MVIFVKPNGETIAENQLLSVGAHSGRISIVAPSRPGAFVEMLVKTPTGELLEPIYAAPVLSISAEDIGLYTCGIVPRMTAASGRVEYQLSFAYEGGEKEVTPMGTFVVQPGNIVLPPDEPSESMYNEIKNAMIAASANYVDVFLRLEKALEAANSVEVNMEIISAAREEALAASDLSASNANVSAANAKTAQGYAEQANIAANRAENALGALGNIKPEEAVNAHNVNTNAHSDIRALILELSNRLATFLNSDDATLDQTKEIVAYIKSNRGLIEAVTTGKISASDIVDNLTTNSSTKPLSAAQGVKLKQLIDGLVVTENDPTVPTWAKQPNKPSYTASEVGARPSTWNPTAADIGAGTFAGAVVAMRSGQTPGTSLLRNSKLVNAETNPTVNGEICWTYK